MHQAWQIDRKESFFSTGRNAMLWIATKECNVFLDKNKERYDKDIINT